MQQHGVVQVDLNKELGENLSLAFKIDLVQHPKSQLLQIAHQLQVSSPRGHLLEPRLPQDAEVLHCQLELLLLGCLVVLILSHEVDMTRRVDRIGTNVNSFEKFLTVALELPELFQPVPIFTPPRQHTSVFLHSVGEVAARHLSASDHHLHYPLKYHVEIDLPALLGLNLILGLEMSPDNIFQVGLELLHSHLGSLPELVIMEEGLSKQFSKDFYMDCLETIESVRHVEHTQL